MANVLGGGAELILPKALKSTHQLEDMLSEAEVLELPQSPVPFLKDQQEWVSLNGSH